jgi:hypothetical protein
VYGGRHGLKLVDGGYPSKSIAAQNGNLRRGFRNNDQSQDAIPVGLVAPAMVDLAPTSIHEICNSNHTSIVLYLIQPIYPL